MASKQPRASLRFENKTYPLYNGVNTIGRNLQAVVNIKNTNISHHHAAIIILDEGKSYVSDLKSSNGTFIDEQKLTPLNLHVLENEASIKFADVGCVYKLSTSNSFIAPPEMSQCYDATIYASNTQMLSLGETRKDMNFHNAETQIMEKSCSSTNIHDLPTQAFDIKTSLNIHEMCTQITPHFNLHDLPTQLMNLENHPVLSDPITETTIDDEAEESEDSIDFMTMQKASETESQVVSEGASAHNNQDSSGANNSENDANSRHGKPEVVEKHESESPSQEIHPVRVGTKKGPFDSDSEDQSSQIAAGASKILDSDERRRSKYFISDDSETDIEDNIDAKEESFKHTDLDISSINDSDFIAQTQDTNFDRTQDSLKEANMQEGPSESFRLELSEISINKGASVDVINTEKINEQDRDFDDVSQLKQVKTSETTPKTNLNLPDTKSLEISEDIMKSKQDLADTDSSPLKELPDDKKQNFINTNSEGLDAVKETKEVPDNSEPEHINNDLCRTHGSSPSSETLNNQASRILGSPKPSTSNAVDSEDENATEEIYVQATQKMNLSKDMQDDQLFKIPSSRSIPTDNISVNDDDLYAQPTQQILQVSHKSVTPEINLDDDDYLQPTQSLEFLHHGGDPKEKQVNEVEDNLHALFASQSDAFNATQQLVDVLEDDVIEDSFAHETILSSTKKNSFICSKGESKSEPDILCTQSLLAGLECDDNSRPMSHSEGDTLPLSPRKVYSRRSKKTLDVNANASTSSGQYINRAQKEAVDSNSASSAAIMSVDTVPGEFDPFNTSSDKNSKSSKKIFNESSLDNSDESTEELIPEVKEKKQKNVNKSTNKRKGSGSSSIISSSSTKTTTKMAQSDHSSEESVKSSTKTTRRTLRKSGSELIAIDLDTTNSSQDDVTDNRAKRGATKTKLDDKEETKKTTKQIKTRKEPDVESSIRRCGRKRTAKKFFDSEESDEEIEKATSKADIISSTDSEKSINNRGAGTSKTRTAKPSAKVSIVSISDDVDDDDFDTKLSTSRTSTRTKNRSGVEAKIVHEKQQKITRATRSTKELSASTELGEISVDEVVSVSSTTADQSPKKSRRLSANSRKLKVDQEKNEVEPKPNRKHKIQDHKEEIENKKVKPSTSNIKGNKRAKVTPSTSNKSELASPERSKRKLKPKVVFTMLDDSTLESVIRQLGGSVVDTVDECTVLVTGSIKRSLKLLCAVGQAKPICSPKWITASRKASTFLDPWTFLLTDKEAEKKWNFTLQRSLERSREHKLLENYTFQILVNNAADVLKGAIESCGGKCVTRNLPKCTTHNLVIVANPENKSKFERIIKQNRQIIVISPEAVFDGTLRQEVQFDKHLIK